MATQVFASMYCGTIALQTAVRFRDQVWFRRSDPLRIYGLPPRLFGLVRLPTPSDTVFRLAGAAFIAALLGAALGIAHRFSLAVALVAYFIYFPPILGLGYIARTSNLIPVVLAILLVAPPEHILAVQLAVAAVYFSAGVAKLRASGLRWADGVALQGYLVQAYMWHEKPAALWISRRRWLCAGLSATVLVWELTFPAAIFFPQVVWIWVLVGVLFHTGTALLMRIHYWIYFGPAYFAFIAEWIARRLQ